MAQNIISGVYKITNIKTNKFYIGASLNIYKVGIDIKLNIKINFQENTIKNYMLI